MNLWIKESVFLLPADRQNFIVTSRNSYKPVGKIQYFFILAEVITKRMWINFKKKL